MGKSSERRNKSRIKYLLRLSETDSKKFSREWSKRLESWANQAKNSAGNLRSEDNSAENSIFNIVDKAETILKQCGKNIFDLEAKATRQILETECIKAVSQAIDYRLNRLTTTGSVCKQKMKPIGKK